MSYLSERLTLWLFRRLGNLILVPNRELAMAAREGGIATARIIRHPLGVDAPRIASVLRGSHDHDRGRFDAVFLGRFHEQKGIEDLAQIWSRVLKTLPSARLAIMGHGKGADRFHRKFGAMSDSAVSFLGSVTGDDKYCLLASASVFMFPSRYESFGHVVLEAMACGLPVVGYDIPSSREAFGDALSYVPLGDTAAFAHETVRLMNDEGLRQVLSARGLLLAKGLNWEHIGSCLLDAIRPT